MYTLIGSALLGALLMGRTKPKTRCSRKTILGPKSGATYEVEDFEEAGFIIVKAADGSQGVFTRAGAESPGGRGFVWKHGKGNPATLGAIYADMGGAPRAVATSGAGDRVPGAGGQGSGGPSVSASRPPNPDPRPPIRTARPAPAAATPMPPRKRANGSTP